MLDDAERRNPDVSYEKHDIRAFAVSATGIAIWLGTVLIVFLLWFLFDYFKNTRAEPRARAELAPEYADLSQPVLQASPRQDLASLRAYESHVLNGYFWASRQKETVIIPIEQAIDKVVTQGIPASGDASGLHLFPPRAGARSTGFDRIPSERQGP